MNGNTLILDRGRQVCCGIEVRNLTADENRHLARVLMVRARELVAHVNRVAGEALLYLSECAGMWMLFGRPDEESVDKLLLHGFTDAEDLARLVMRLENEMRGVGDVVQRGVEDVAPYRKERLMV